MPGPGNGAIRRRTVVDPRVRLTIAIRTVGPVIMRWRWVTATQGSTHRRLSGSECVGRILRRGRDSARSFRRESRTYCPSARWLRGGTLCGDESGSARAWRARAFGAARGRGLLMLSALILVVGLLLFFAVHGREVGWNWIESVLGNRCREGTPTGAGVPFGTRLV